ncbi:hypothetical protein M0R45_019470 [Rubus argutus]|uniref:Uncharacterized protein n=1 Tax=Rubus argutus TaxID=59490 RepID=A0AAW1X6U4_RUBAR
MEGGDAAETATKSHGQLEVAQRAGGSVWVALVICDGLEMRVGWWGLVEFMGNGCFGDWGQIGLIVEEGHGFGYG